MREIKEGGFGGLCPKVPLGEGWDESQRRRVEKCEPRRDWETLTSEDAPVGSGGGGRRPNMQRAGG